MHGAIKKEYNLRKNKNKSLHFAERLYISHFLDKNIKLSGQVFQVEGG